SSAAALEETKLEVSSNLLRLINNFVLNDNGPSKLQLTQSYGYELYPIGSEKDALQFQKGTPLGNRLKDIARQQGFPEDGPSIDDEAVLIDNDCRAVASELALNIALHARQRGAILFRPVQLSLGSEVRKGIEILAYDLGQGFQAGIAR